MSLTDLIADLKSSLQDAATVFDAPADADFIRHLNQAALDMGRVRPRTLVGELALVAAQPNYPAPADLLRPKFPLWGMAERQQRRPWDKAWPGPAPRLSLVDTGSGRELWLDPAPTEAQISLLGARYRFYYFATHQIDVDASKTTVLPGDRGLLLLRAQAEAMLEMAMRNIKKPVQLRDGSNSAPKNGTPAALASWLLEAFARQAA
ncbi:MAG: hypothetical protein ACOY5C_02785 [Pseudomonadota bacterium]